MPKKAKVAKDTSERWLLTYSDLMNLLLILFIILYTMSKVDVAKYQQVAASLRQAFGESTSATYMIPGGNSIVNMDSSAPSPVIPANVEEEQMQEIKERVDQLVQQQNLGDNVQVAIEERGIAISITAQLLFKSGSAEIENGSKQTIQDIGKILLAVPGRQIRVEGHTDDDPISTSKYPDNLELSTARANNVWRLLINAVGIDPNIISSVGYGEYRPKVPNTSEENKAVNRRVDIVILRSIYDKAEAGSDTAQQGSAGTGAGTGATTHEATSSTSQTSTQKGQ